MSIEKIIYLSTQANSIDAPTLPLILYIYMPHREGIQYSNLALLQVHHDLLASGGRTKGGVDVGEERRDGDYYDALRYWVITPPRSGISILGATLADQVAVRIRF